MDDVVIPYSMVEEFSLGDREKVHTQRCASKTLPS
jgi:hypothetical protein